MSSKYSNEVRAQTHIDTVRYTNIKAFAQAPASKSDQERDSGLSTAIRRLYDKLISLLI